MPPTIEVNGLRKRYGTAVAVDGLTFTVQPGRVTGFVGPNGSGKSTTMRLILGLDTADAGTATIGGRPYRSLQAPLDRGRRARSTRRPCIPAGARHDHLLWLAHSNGLAKRRIDEVLDMVGLAGVARKRVGGFSLGMRQRLGIAAALLGDPPVLMLDEPVNGLDPDGVVWIRDLLRRTGRRGPHGLRRQPPDG